MHALALVILLAGQVASQPARDDAEQASAQVHTPVLTRAPKLLEGVQPEYPEAARAEGVTGEVVLRLTLDATGKVTDAEVTRSLHPLLDAAALEAARRLRFSPAEVDGEPAPVQLEFRFAFTLQPPKPPEPDANAPPPPPPPPNLRGTVRVRGRRTPIEGALVVVDGELSARTDEAGRFSLHVPPGNRGVEVKAPGFFPFETREIVREDRATEVTYYVQREARSPYETVIRAKKPRKEVSEVTLEREELRKVPGTFGDPLRVLENLPGMARSSFIGGQLLVRGANPEDSGVYFDGVPLPLLYHFGGLTSVVNAEFLDAIDFRPGGFGAEYGRATAGIVDVSSRRLTGKLARGSAKIDLMDTALFYRRPITENLAFGVAVRRSYVDLLLPPILKAAGNTGMTVAPQYTDYQLKVDWDLCADQDLTFFAFGSLDTLRLITPVQDRDAGFSLKLSVGFHRLLVDHTWRIARGLTLHSRPWVGVTVQRFGGGEIGQPGGGFSVDVALGRTEAGLREHLTWRPDEHLTLRAGLDLLYLRMKAEVDAPIGGDLLSFPAPEQPLADNQTFSVTEDGSGDGLWVEATWRPTPAWAITPGLRAEAYVFPKKVRPVLEPRLALRYTLRAGSVLKAATGLYHQPPNVLALSEQTGNPLIRPEAALHYILGFEQTLTDLIDLDLELFYNDRFHRVVSSDAVVLRDGEEVAENVNNDGLGRAYGLELLLRHKLSDRFFGWVAYTLMHAEARDHPGDPFVRTDTDQTHILTVIASYRPWRNFEAGLRLRLVSGNPYTPVLGAVHDLDTESWRPIRGDPNSARLPTFFQLDLRVEYTSVYDLFTVSYFLDLQNATNRKNVEDFNYDYRYRERVDFNGLPIFPVLGVRGAF